MKARLRPIIAPTLPPVIINAAITSVYIVIAVWMPVTSVPTSLATTGIDTFITELSSAITNWPAASAASTMLAFERCSEALTDRNLSATGGHQPDRTDQLVPSGSGRFGQRGGTATRRSPSSMNPAQAPSGSAAARSAAWVSTEPNGAFQKTSVRSLVSCGPT